MAAVFAFYSVRSQGTWKKVQTYSRSGERTVRISGATDILRGTFGGGASKTRGQKQKNEFVL